MENVRSCLWQIYSWGLMALGIGLLGGAIYRMVMGAVGQGALVDPWVLGLSALAGVFFAFAGVGLMGWKPTKAPMIGLAAVCTAVASAGVMQSVQWMAAGHTAWGLLALLALVIGAVIFGLVHQLRYNKRAQRKIEDLALQTIGAAPQDEPVRLRGATRPAEHPVSAPISARAVLAAHVQLKYQYRSPYGGTNWAPGVQHLVIGEFFLEDETGRLRVCADEGAVVDVVGLPIVTSQTVPEDDPQIGHWLARAETTAPVIHVLSWTIEERTFELGEKIELRGVITQEGGERVMRPRKGEPIYISRTDREGVLS